MLEFTPIVVAGGLGALDEVLENQDNQQGRTTNMQQYSFWYEAALLGVPAFMEMSGQVPYQMRWLWDPALVVGSALLGRRASKYIRTQSVVPTGGYVTRGYAVPAARGYSVPAAMSAPSPASPPAASGFVNKQPSYQLV